MYHVLAQSHPWINAPSMDGASTTVCIVEMQEWHAKVQRCNMYTVMCLSFSVCMCRVNAREGGGGRIGRCEIIKLHMKYMYINSLRVIAMERGGGGGLSCD